MSTVPLKNTQQPFSWVKPELEKSVGFVRAALENYGRDLNNFEPLIPALEQLYLLRGSLHILELYGAALLIEDMELTVKALLSKTLANPEDGFEALVKAALSLEGYLEKLAKDPADIPLILLPIMNDLRASRNQPLLTESNLFNPNLSIVPKFPDKQGLQEGMSQQIGETAKTLRPYYQAALLSWYRNPKDTLSLQQMKLVLRNLESSSYSPRLRQLWWIAGGLVEALADSGINSNIAVRLLLGHADRMIKLISQQQEPNIEKTPPVDLLKNMLFYIAHSASRGERVTTLKRAYQLDSLIPSETDLKNLRENIRTPKSETFGVIANELNKTIQKIKTIIDGFVRGNVKDATVLEEVLIPLRHIADTLSLISMGKERQLLLKQIEHATKTINEKRLPNRDELLSLASAIVHIESVINNIGNERRTISRPMEKFTEKRKSRESANTAMDNNAQTNMLNRVPETEYRILVQKAAEEARNNVTNIKNSILAFLTSPLKHKLLVDVPRLLNEIHGCLIIIDHPYAARLVKAIGEYTQKNILGSEIQPPKAELDEFAEAVVGLEFYLESIAEGRAQLESILEITRESMLKLGFKVDPPKNSDAKSIPTLENIVTHIYDAAKGKPSAKTGTDIAKVKVQDTKENKIIPLEVEEDIDPEVKEIFIEEARDELRAMEKNIAALKISHDDRNAINNIRRVFHTLKGSGRIAGANPISEFATVLEEFVNRIAVGSIALDDSGIKILDDAFNVIQELLECYRDKTPVPVHANKLIHDVMALLGPSPAQSKPRLETFTIPTTTKPTPTPPPSVVAAAEKAFEPQATPAISETTVIAKTINERAPIPVRTNELATLDKKKISDTLYSISQMESFIQARRNADDESPISDEILKAIEQLYGIASTIRPGEFSQTTDLLLRYARNLAKNQTPVQQETLDILNEYCVTTREMVTEPTNEIPPAPVDEPQPRRTRTSPEVSLISRPRTTALTPKQESEQGKPDTQTEDDLTLIDIFFDEARELVQQGNENLDQWKNTTPNAQHVESLQRILHTLKGSARMAGITLIGNLGHQLETLLENVLGDNIRADASLNDVLQQSFDAVGDIIESLAHGAEVNPQYSLFDSIRRYAEQHLTTVASEDAPVEMKPELNEELTPYTPEPSSLSENIERQQAEDIEAEISAPTGEKKGEPIRIDASIVDSMVNAANEENIIQHKAEDHIGSIKTSLLELDRTITRLRNQMRDVEFGYDTVRKSEQQSNTFDLTQFSSQQEAAQRVLESIGDLENLHGALTRLTLETDNLLHQQRKIHGELYDQLLGSRLVSFANQNQRFQKIVRQTARELGKQVQLVIHGGEGALDRAILDKLTGPIEHLLRNAIAHGIESPELRKERGKPDAGLITITLSKEDSDHVIRISDDGSGINVEAIRKKAEKNGLLKSSTTLSDDDLIQLIFEPGFSTSDTISQIAGRGVGMDVVNTEIQKLGGRIDIETEQGVGTQFTLRLPYTISLNKTLLVRCGETTYAIPSASVDGTQLVTNTQLEQLYANQTPSLTIDHNQYPLWYLDSLLNDAPTVIKKGTDTVSILLLRNNRTRAALHVDEIIETRNTILKPTGPQLTKVKGITGATVLDEGSIALILDIPALLRAAILRDRKDIKVIEDTSSNQPANTPRILVVDDSVTVRKVTERFLRRNGYQVATAKDGLEALEILQENIKPDVILLDIEMPRLDGLETARRIRSHTDLRSIPIIMITSRAGKTHREAAQQAGVNVFLGKPYQETQLLENIKKLVPQHNK